MHATMHITTVLFPCQPHLAQSTLSPSLYQQTWHPGRRQNLEEVWKREQDAVKEQQRLKELQKQIEEERAKEEMLAVAQAAGVKVYVFVCLHSFFLYLLCFSMQTVHGNFTLTDKMHTYTVQYRRSDRLDWMYQGGVGARQEADQRHQLAAETAQKEKETLETKAVEKKEEENAKQGGGTALPAFYSEDTPASANEMWQRLHADPLFAIKQQEVSARRNILSNPMQMQAIKSQVNQLKGKSGGGREKEKEKERKKKRSSRRSRSRSRSRSPERRRDRDRSPERKRDRNRDRDRSRERRRDRDRDKERRRRRYSGSEDDSDAYRRRKSSRRKEREKSRSRSPRPASAPKAHRRHRSPQQPQPQQPSKDHQHQYHRDGASAQGANVTKYGITYGSIVPDAVRDQDRSEAAEATRRRLDEARKKVDEEEREEERQQQLNRKRKQQHRPGQLTEEERKKRLAEMTTAAQDHDASRQQRIQEYGQVEAKEEAEHRSRVHDGNKAAAFLHQQSKGEEGGGSLADAVGRRRAFVQRGGDGSAFRR